MVTAETTPAICRVVTRETILPTACPVTSAEPSRLPRTCTAAIADPLMDASPCADDVTAMRARGLALGGTLENAVVFDGDRVLSPGGLRYIDEPVRHKMLDALGDLALAGGPILGRYTGIRAGHALTNRLLRALFAAPDAWRYDDCGAATGKKLPGVGVHQGDLPARQ